MHLLGFLHKTCLNGRCGTHKINTFTLRISVIYYIILSFYNLILFATKSSHCIFISPLRNNTKFTVFLLRKKNLNTADILSQYFGKEIQIIIQNLSEYWILLSFLILQRVHNDYRSSHRLRMDGNRGSVSSVVL